MKFYPLDARTEEGRRKWLQLRLGIATASSFNRIITPKKLELSEQRYSLRDELLEEWMTGEEVERYASEWQQRGIEEEDAAIAAYEAARGETSPGGFFTSDDGLIGCSPDRLIGNNGDLEIKTGALRTGIGYKLGQRTDIAADHQLQIQGRLWIHGREWCETFGYFHHRSGQTIILPPVRVYREEKIIKALKEHLPRFVEELLRAREELERDHGPFLRLGSPAPPDPLEVSQADLDRIFAAQKEHA